MSNLITIASLVSEIIMSGNGKTDSQTDTRSRYCGKVCKVATTLQANKQKRKYLENNDFGSRSRVRAAHETVARVAVGDVGIHSHRFHWV